MLASVAVLWAATLNAGTAVEASTNSLDLIPDKPSLWSESLLWDEDITLRAGIGYKDNVLLSSSAPQGSAFFTSGLDLLVFRLPLDGWAFNLGVTGDDVQYWRNVGGVTAEDTFLANAQAQKYLGSEWRCGLDLKYLYADQVALSLQETGGVSAVMAKVQTVGVQPFVRRDLGTNAWLQVAFPIARDWEKYPLDDDWKFGAQPTLARTYGYGSQLALSCGASYIAHDAWLATDAEGNQIPGERLAVWEETAELKWDHRWDAARRWRTITKLGFRYDQDNGAGFYNYYCYTFSEELSFATANWEIKGTAGVSYYDFPVQTVDATPGNPTLYLTVLDLTLRVERRIYKSFKVFGEYDYERVLSNESDSAYTYNIVKAELSWEF